jgi:hypothetical protein
MRPTLALSILALAAMQPLFAATPATTLSTETSLQIPAAGVSWQAVALGREVYKDLLRTQMEAADHNEIDTRMALHDASRILDSLYEPAMARALRQQVAIIRQELAREGMKPEPGLWLPIEAELNTVMLAAPPEHQERAKTALAAGRAAAARGDRNSAREQLKVLEEMLDYRWGLLPLNRIRGDVHSAELALDPDPPDWKGVDEAMQSALDAVRWVTTADATGWFSAYEEAVHASLLLPENPQLARFALERVGKDLDGLQDATPLAQQAHKLAVQKWPDSDAVKSLLQELRSGITP